MRPFAKIHGPNCCDVNDNMLGHRPKVSWTSSVHISVWANNMLGHRPKSSTDRKEREGIFPSSCLLLFLSDGIERGAAARRRSAAQRTEKRSNRRSEDDLPQLVAALLHGRHLGRRRHRRPRRGLPLRRQGTNLSIPFPVAMDSIPNRPYKTAY